MKLPTEKNKIVELNPKYLILFGKPKSGKTTIIQGLKDALHMDFEKGSSYVSTMKVNINNIKDLKDLLGLLKNKQSETKGYVYTYGVLDTATALEDLTLGIALKDYKSTTIGKNFKGNDIRKLANGGGYLYLREAFKKVINLLSPYFKYLILLGHVKDVMINNNGKEMSEYRLDLTGKLERITSANADALGYLFRRKNQTLINFNGGGESIVEARPSHLRGKEIVIAESDEKGNMKYFWDKIFIE